MTTKGMRLKEFCVKGHPRTPENLRPNGGCRECRRISATAERRAAGMKPKVSKCPHGPDAPKNSSGCKQCNREREAANRRIAGVPERVRADLCRRGHDLTVEENRRKSSNGQCAICHRMDALERYWSRVEESRRESREYSKKVPVEAKTARTRAWRAANPERAREQARQGHRARQAGRTPEGKEYVEILLRDPCSYCGGPAGTIDHIRPIARGGLNEWENLTAACGRCNQRKKDAPLLKFMLRMALEP